MSRILTAAVFLLAWWPQAAAAQTYAPAQARRQFITISYNWLYTWPLHFGEHPVEDLVGRPVAATDNANEYRSRDGRTLVNVLEFTRPGQGVGLTVYPLGLRAGPTLGIRGTIETLPDIQMAFEGPSLVDAYALTGATAYDVGVGLYVADRAPGWGLGGYAFAIGGIGRITSDLGDGSRYFAEGGGGLQTGPFGFEISAKFGWNRMTDPVEHRFLTVPINMRATVSF